MLSCIDARGDGGKEAMLSVQMEAEASRSSDGIARKHAGFVHRHPGENTRCVIDLANGHTLTAWVSTFMASDSDCGCRVPRLAPIAKSLRPAQWIG
jgi:hypothetical protein